MKKTGLRNKFQRVKERMARKTTSSKKILCVSIQEKETGVLWKLRPQESCGQQNILENN